MIIQDIILFIGIPTIATALIYIGRKLQILDTVEKTVESIRDRFIVVEERVETLWKDKLAPASSPRQLNDKGNSILNNSNIKEIVDEKKVELLKLVKNKNAKNAYDAEIAIEEVMKELLTHFPNIVDRLKSGAFKVGSDIGELLFVGSIYLRNQIFSDLGFSLDDLDKPKTSTSLK